MKEFSESRPIHGHGIKSAGFFDIFSDKKTAEDLGPKSYL